MPRPALTPAKLYMAGVLLVAVLGLGYGIADSMGVFGAAEVSDDELQDIAPAAGGAGRGGWRILDALREGQR